MFSSLPELAILSRAPNNPIDTNRSAHGLAIMADEPPDIKRAR
jgi:hypothetical protein